MLYKYVGIILIIAVLIYYFNSGLSENFSINIDEKECPSSDNNLAYSNLMNAVKAPNAPFDSQTAHQTGGKNAKQLDQPLVPLTGRHIFPRYKLLYDGVYEEETKMDNKNVEQKTWKLTPISCGFLVKWFNANYLSCQPKHKTNLHPLHSTYGISSDFLHLPEAEMPNPETLIPTKKEFLPNSLHGYCPLGEDIQYTESLPFFPLIKP